MGVFHRGSFFEKQSQGALSLLLYSVTLTGLRDSLDIKVAICNNGSIGEDYRPFYIWYTFERPGMKSTIHWALKSDDDATDQLSIGECKTVTMRSLPQDSANTPVALDKPLGVIHFSPNGVDSFCELQLPKRPTN